MIKDFAGALLLLTALVPSARLVWQARDMPSLGAVHDDQFYWITAKSLAEGEGYRTLSEPGRPFHTYYPPLYPALLSLIWMVDSSFPDNLRLASVANWCLLPVFAAVSFCYFRQTGLGWFAWPSAAFVAVLPIVVMSSLRLMTELLFGSLTLVTLMTLERGAAAKSAWLAAVAGLLAGAAYLTRAAGLVLALAGAAALCLLYRRYLRAFWFAAVSTPAIAGWAWWVHVHAGQGFANTGGSYSGYMDIFLEGFDLRSHLTVAGKNAAALARSAGSMFVFSAPDWLCWALDIGMLAGAVLLLRSRRSRAYGVFAIGYVGTLILWTFPPDQRLVMPLLPFLVASIVEATRSACRLLGAPRSGTENPGKVPVSLAWLAVACAAAVIGTFASYGTLRYSWPAFIDSERRELARDRVANRWIISNTSADAGFVSDRPAVLYLYTGRPGGAPDLVTSDWYRSSEYRAEDWLRSVPGYLSAHSLRYAMIRERDWAGLSADRRLALENWFVQSGLLRCALSCEGCAIYQRSEGR